MKTTLLLKYPNEVIKIFYYLKLINVNDDKNLKTFDEFIRIVEKFSEKLSEDKEIQKKFKGDMLEIFSEIFFYCFQNDPEIGLKDYAPISIDQDYGCDAIGVNAGGLTCAVQVKFRSNPLDSVTYEELSKTDASARRILNIDTLKENSIWLFTSAFDVSNSARKVLGKSLVVINKNKIKYLVDNNISFWDKAWKIIKEHK